MIYMSSIDKIVEISLVFMGFKSFFLRIGEVSCFLGVCTKTLRRWDEIGNF